jgi:hypothetical protein
MPHIAASAPQPTKKLSLDAETARLAKLREKAAALETENRTLSKQRQQLALDAHSGDQAARKELDKIRQSSLTLQFERESLVEAIQAQAERCRQAEVSERQAKAKSIAVEDQERLAGLKQLAKQVDGHLEAAAVGIGTLMTELRSIINRNGVSRPTEGLLRSNIARALASSKIGRLLEVPLPGGPSARTDFEPLVTSWTLAIKSELAAVISGRSLPRSNGQDHADAGDDTDLAGEASAPTVGHLGAPGDTPFWVDQAVKAIETNGEGCPYQKKHFYSAILAIADRLKVPGESADATRRRGMQSVEGKLLWSAHNVVNDLPPKADDKRKG